MPKAGAASKADYQRNRAYYIARETSAAGKHKRVERDQARNEMIKAGALKGAHDPRTVDHKKSMAKGGSGTARSNLQILSATANRKKYDH
jgi:5-methylcytosine-specific restriction endonuclease McrA